MKSRETLQIIPTPLDLLPPRFQKHGPPTQRTTLQYPQSEHEFLEARKIMLQRSQILKIRALLSSSRIPSTFKVTIEKATMITNSNQRDKRLSDKEN